MDKAMASIPAHLSTSFHRTFELKSPSFRVLSLLCLPFHPPLPPFLPTFLLYAISPFPSAFLFPFTLPSEKNGGVLLKV